MLNLLNSSLIALALVAAAPALAKDSCPCSEKCMAACQKGKSENCPCKKCGCSEGDSCSHGNKCASGTKED